MWATTRRPSSTRPLSKPKSVDLKAACKVTGWGVALGAGASALFVIGFLLGNGELITLGACGLLALAGARVIAPLNVRDLEVRIELPSHFFAGRDVKALVELQNRRRWFHARNVDIAMHFPHQVERMGRASWTRAQGASVLLEPISIPARVEASEVECEIRSSFPLGLFVARRLVSADCPALVYPPLITPPELLLNGSNENLSPASASGPGDIFGDPRGIRPYQPGDKATRIHQSATARSMARGRGLQVRAYDPPGDHPHGCRIVFHSCASEGEIIRPDRFERGLSLAAGALAHFQASQTKVTFQADFNDWSCRPCDNRAQYFDCLELLTRTERSPQTKADELQDILRNLPDKEQLIVISDSPAAGWRDLIKAIHPKAILINIQQVRFDRRSMKFQPSGSP